MTKPDKLQAVHEQAIERINAIWSVMHEIRTQCAEDRRFYSVAGAQWDGNLAETYENKPKFEVNKIHLSIIKIINEYRNNRISVDFLPKDDQSDDMSDTLDALYRADEQNSNAQEAYDNAYEEGVGGGFGAFRLLNKYEDEEDEDDDAQRICFEPIFDADIRVFFDLDAKRQDKSDANYCFVLTSMTRKAFEDQYNDSQPYMFDVELDSFEWVCDDSVYIAEYYNKEQTTTNFWWLTNPITGETEKTSDEETFEGLKAQGWELDKQKKVKQTRVHKYIIGGDEVLEDLGYIAGKHIPIIPFFGKRFYIDNVEHCMGHVRMSKDPQRIKNVMLSKLVEISAEHAVSKPIFLAEQIVGHETMWADDNIDNNAFLTVNAVRDAMGNIVQSQPVGYTKPPEIPPALGALMQITEADIQDLLGNTNDGQQLAGQISTQTAELITEQLSAQSYIYMSNFAKAMRRAGEVYFDMAKEVYGSAERTLLGRDPENDLIPINLNAKEFNEQGEIVAANNLRKAKMEVYVDVGPTSSTKRRATLRALTNAMQFTQGNPQDQMILGSLAMMNMEGEGISEARGYFRKRLVQMGVYEPTKEEALEMQQSQQNQQPSPEEQYYLAEAAKAQADAQKKQVEIAKVQAETAETIAQTSQTEAETIKTLQEADTKQGELALKTLEKFGTNVQPVSVPLSPIGSGQ